MFWRENVLFELQINVVTNYTALTVIQLVIHMLIIQKKLNLHKTLYRELLAILII